MVTTLPGLVLLTISLIGLSFGYSDRNMRSPNRAGPLVERSLYSKEESSIMISMKDSAIGKLSGIKGQSNISREAKATKVTHILQNLATVSQRPVLSVLETMGVTSESYWISNQIFVRDANPGIVKALMRISSISSILEEKVISILDPIPDLGVGKAPDGNEWNVEMMEVPKVWENGTTGEGILVGGIDTGVRLSHEALKDNYVGKLGWHDPYLHTSTPSDLQGHGTHTMGTIVGSNGIGIAPGAKWMACKGCLLSSCQQHTLLACGQFMICPSSPNSGKNRKQCKGIPHIVNNSWGTGGGENFYDAVIQAWLAVGIKPFFAQGNSGPKCETGMSPADNDHVIAVGSTDKNDRLSEFSSRGPKIKNEQLEESAKERNDPKSIFVLDVLNPTNKKVTLEVIKPDICAPGEKVNSAFILKDDSYKVMSGTSMAAPAASGVAALLLSKNPTLSLKNLKKLLYSTTDKELNLTPGKAKECGPIPEDEYPNHMCGHGRINAWQAYKVLKKDMKEMGKKRSKSKKGKKKDGKTKKPSDGNKTKTDVGKTEKPPKSFALPLSKLAGQRHAISL